jgi:hypothetical protein
MQSTAHAALLAARAVVGVKAIVVSAVLAGVVVVVVTLVGAAPAVGPSLRPGVGAPVPAVARNFRTKLFGQ